MDLSPKCDGASIILVDLSATCDSGSMIQSRDQIMDLFSGPTHMAHAGY